jgi:hypothetical protein
LGITILHTKSLIQIIILIVPLLELISSGLKLIGLWLELIRSLLKLIRPRLKWQLPWQPRLKSARQRTGLTGKLLPWDLLAGILLRAVLTLVLLTRTWLTLKLLSRKLLTLKLRRPLLTIGGLIRRRPRRRGRPIAGIVRIRSRLPEPAGRR